MITCYSLRPVLVDGVEMLARPISWAGLDQDGFGHNDDGSDVVATGFHTTCPHCSSLIEFNLQDIVVASDGENVTCRDCGRGQSGVSLLKSTVPVSVTLVDPIALGLFTEVDVSRLVPKLS